jgi:hypothetical protein
VTYLRPIVGPILAIGADADQIVADIHVPPIIVDAGHNHQSPSLAHNSRCSNLGHKNHF